MHLNDVFIPETIPPTSHTCRQRRLGRQLQLAARHYDVDWLQRRVLTAWRALAAKAMRSKVRCAAFGRHASSCSSTGSAVCLQPQIDQFKFTCIPFAGQDTDCRICTGSTPAQRGCKRCSTAGAGEMHLSIHLSGFPSGAFAVGMPLTTAAHPAVAACSAWPRWRRRWQLHCRRGQSWSRACAGRSCGGCAHSTWR